ncbi:xylose repressor protein [Paraliobacillus quinghaiensis]|uniref:Xylose repressor protein n=1 Tax=Paraliobacillus quinghaiensis TaxID=470815 RepID=A0A917TUL1_9BACI|nr:ROK family protein [Paraliobacillus quinghaiensis]GGM38718.1 xylose repressor protein [Paraliobacillus quinghaiensis]
MKMQLRKGNRDLIKEINRSLVIEQVRSIGQISRTDLAKKTGLGLSTITNIVEGLIKERIIYEVGSGFSNGGRRPVFLKFNEEAGAVIGVKVEPKKVIFALTDLDIKIILKSEIPLDPEVSNEQLLKLIIREIEALKAHLRTEQHLYGIGIAISGLVDRSKNTLKYSPILNWENYDFSPLESYFKIPVFVDNDANVFTLAHMWSGKWKEYNHFIGVTFGVGTGAGIVVNKELYRGSFGGSGEFGHIVIQREGTLCYCGQRGCLEMYASDDYLIQETKNLVQLGLSEKFKSSESITIQDIYVAAQQGDKNVQQLLVKQGENLGIGLKSIVNLLNPEAIIIGGEGTKGMPHVGIGIKKEIAFNFFSKHEQKLNVHMSDLGDDVWLVGACALVLDDKFKAPIYQ